MTRDGHGMEVNRETHPHRFLSAPPAVGREDHAREDAGAVLNFKANQIRQAGQTARLKGGAHDGERKLLMPNLTCSSSISPGRRRRACYNPPSRPLARRTWFSGRPSPLGFSVSRGGGTAPPCTAW